MSLPREKSRLAEADWLFGGRYLRPIRSQGEKSVVWSAEDGVLTVGRLKYRARELNL